MTGRLLIDRSRASPNHGPRIGFEAPDAIVLHYTGMRDGPMAIDWLCDPVSQVSCHYVVSEDGRVLQLVPDEHRAWHAGRSFWRGETDMNSASLGIEIVNGGHDFGLPPFPAPQIEAVAALCRVLIGRHGVAAHRILAHSDIAPGRKRDPGERFPWEKLAAEGIGLWPAESIGSAARTSAPDNVGNIQDRLSRLGYGITRSNIADDETATVVRAFQRRYRPQRVDGIPDPQTFARLEAVLRLHDTAANRSEI